MSIYFTFYAIFIRFYWQNWTVNLTLQFHSQINWVTKITQTIVEKWFVARLLDQNW